LSRTYVYRGELTSAVSAALLLALMFLTKWYGVAGVPDPSAARPARSTAENAWNGLSEVRWAMLATILVVLGSVVLHASQRSHGTRTDTSRVLLAFGTINAVLLFYRVLIALPEPTRVIDQKLGAVFGLVCALGIAVGGLEAVGEQRRLAQAVSAHPRHRRPPGTVSDDDAGAADVIREDARTDGDQAETARRPGRRISSSP
jgi:hypothetical protein